MGRLDLPVSSVSRADAKHGKRQEVEVPSLCKEGRPPRSGTAAFSIGTRVWGA